MDEERKRMLLNQINPVAEKAVGKPFRGGGTLYDRRTGTEVGEAWVCDFEVGGYTTPTIDLVGKTVVVGEEEDDVLVYSARPVEKVPATGRGWNSTVRKVVREAFENPGSFVDYELEIGRRNSFG